MNKIIVVIAAIVAGMLSVNARTGQVFLHHWHGESIEMTGAAHD